MHIPIKEWGSCVETLSDGSQVATLACVPILLLNIINFMTAFAGVVALFFIAYGGIKYTTSQGDQAKVQSAQKTIFFAIIGLVLVVLSLVILQFIKNVIGVS